MPDEMVNIEVASALLHFVLQYSFAFIAAFLGYLAAFDLHPFDEQFYVVDAAAPAIALERPAHSTEPPDFTLEQAIEGKPWVGV